MTGPAVLILLRIEASPEVYTCAPTNSDAVRLRDWFDARPELYELLDRAVLLREQWKRGEST